MIRSLCACLALSALFAAAPVALAQDGGPSGETPAAKPAEPKATEGESPSHPDGDAAPKAEEAKTPRSVESRMGFADFSYRFHIEDGSPQPSSFHDWRLGFGFGSARGYENSDWNLGYTRLVVHGRSNSRKRGSMDAVGLSLAFGNATLKQLILGEEDEKDAKDDLPEELKELEASIRPRPYAVNIPRAELELGIAHTPRFWVGAPAGSRVDRLNGRTGFRIGVLAEVEASVSEFEFAVQYSYAREYYSSSGTIKDTTILVKTDMSRQLALSAGHRRLSSMGYIRTMFLFGIELAF